MERCKTCPHWKLAYALSQWGECHLARLSLKAERTEGQRRSLAFAMAFPVPEGQVATHESYGCVMHPGNGGERLPA